jgi:TolB protein
MTFSPRFTPDGRRVVYSLSNGGNTDIVLADLSSGASTRLTSAPSIETAPSFSPDGSQMVFESDRSGTQQLYVISTGGGSPRDLVRQGARYGTPVWSPRGDLIAFTKQSGRFHIGVMRTNGSEERLLTAGELDEGPTWAPNGRVLMFTRSTLGRRGGRRSIPWTSPGGRRACGRCRRGHGLGPELGAAPAVRGALPKGRGLWIRSRGQGRLQ